MSVATGKQLTEGSLLLDLVERSLMLVISVWAIWRLAPAITREPQVSLVLASEMLAVAFILLRRPARRIDVSPYAAAVAFVGTAAPLLVIAPGHGWLLPAVGSGLMIVGLLLNISAKIALNRSFGLAAANRGVKRSGPYRLLRHPMYTGYALTQAVFLLLNPCLWNLCVYGIAWSVQILRIGAEEKILQEDPAYREYASQVRFRLIPGVY